MNGDAKAEVLKNLLFAEWRLWDALPLAEKKKGQIHASAEHKAWHHVRQAIHALDPTIDINENATPDNVIPLREVTNQRTEPNG